MLIKKNKIPFLKIATVGILPSFLKKRYYRLKGYKIGKDVRLGIGSIIIGKEVSIEDGVTLGFVSVIRARSVKLGRYVKIGSMTMIDTGVLSIDEDSRVNENVVVGGTPSPDSRLTIGKRAIIMQYSYINTTMPITIGDDSGIGGHCLLFTHGSWLNQMDGFPVAFAPITIGKNVWLPWRVFIMPGITLGDNVVIGANSMINKDIPANTLAAGSPAKVIKTNFPAALDSEQRAGILTSAILSFKEYMEYEGFDTTFQEDESRIEMSVLEKKGPYSLIYAKTKSYSSDLSKQIDVFVSDQKELDIPSNALMVLDTHRKTRKGSTEMGEEFLKFISRYGIRFDRID